MPWWLHEEQNALFETDWHLALHRLVGNLICLPVKSMRFDKKQTDKTLFSDRTLAELCHALLGR